MNAEETDDGQVQEWRSYEQRRAVCPCVAEGKDCACEDDGEAALERAAPVAEKHSTPGSPGSCCRLAFEGAADGHADCATPRARGQAP